MARRLFALSFGLLAVAVGSYMGFQSKVRQREITETREREQNHEHTIQLVNAISHGETTQASYLLEGDLSLQNYSGNEAFRIAAYNGQKELLRKMLPMGVEVDARSGMGQTALQYAAQNGKVDAAKFLLNHGAEVNRQSPGGGTALTMAAAGGYDKMVALLLSRGANFQIRNKNGDSAESLARKGKTLAHREVVRLLQRRTRGEATTPPRRP